MLYLCYTDANCENCSPMAEYCYSGDDLIGYFCALLVYYSGSQTATKDNKNKQAVTQDST